MTHDDAEAFFAEQQAAWDARDADRLTAGHAEDCRIISPIFRTVEGRKEILES